MMRETIDESIDRVASAMTAVAADPGFSARLDGRLAPRAAPVWRWLAIPAAAAVLAAAVVLVLPGRDDSAEPQVPPAPSTLHSAAVPVRAIPPPVAALMRPAAARSDGVRSRREAAVEDDEAFETRIAALPAPAPLSVAALAVESLAIAAVDVGELALPVIAVGDIPGGEPKEQ